MRKLENVRMRKSGNKIFVILSDSEEPRSIKAIAVELKQLPFS
jgi:hypothetical protein